MFEKQMLALVSMARSNAEEIIAEAQEKACRMERDAKANARRIEEEARREADAVHRRALDDAQREAYEIKNRVRKEAEAAAEQEYKAVYAKFAPEAAKELVESYRRQDNAFYAFSAQDSSDVLRAYGTIREDICHEVTRLQSEINAALIGFRESLYKREAEPLAACVVNLYAILCGLDNRIAEGRWNDETQDVLVRLRKNLAIYDKQLRLALRGVGLDVYTAKDGDIYDPAFHAVVGGTGKVIASCEKPGVRISGGNAIYRAEVILCESDGLKHE